MTMPKVLVLSSEKVATTCDNAKSIPFEMLRFNLKCSVSNKQATSNAGAYQVAYQTVGHLISKRLREGSERLREAPGTAGTYQVAYQTVRHLISKMLRAGQRRSVRHSYGQWWTCPVASGFLSHWTSTRRANLTCPAA